jgi:hypothetical protein
MDKPGGLTLILILIFAGLFLFVIFLALKRKSKGILGSRPLVFGAIIAMIIVFMVIREPIVEYYQSIFKEAPYNFSEFKSFVFKYGHKDSLVNQYNSASGDYQYLDKRDSLIKTRLYLTTDELLYLHRKAAELGFWDFPSDESKADTVNTNGVKPTEFLIEFNYKHKSKTVLFNGDYDGPRKLAEANRLLITEIQAVLRVAEEREKK